MNKELQDRIVTAVYSYVPQPISDYLEDLKNDNDRWDLAITLKHWANPLGGFSVCLPEKALNDDFKYLQEILNHPKKLLNEDKNITPADEKVILTLVRKSLDNQADEIIKQYNLTDKYNQLRANLQCEEEADEWWSKKNEAEKKEIREKFAALKAKERTLGSQEKVALPTYFIVTNSEPSAWNYYCTCNHFTYIDYLLMDQAIRASFEAGRVLLGLVKIGINAAARAIGEINFDLNGSGCSGGCSGGSKDDALVVVAIVGFLAIIAAGLIGGAYAGKKLINSIINLVHGDKIWRSMFRIVSIGGSAYGGVAGGIIIGAALGSLIPGFGTAAGALVGAIFCAAACAGVGALTSKYLSKGLSSIVYAESINPSNPEKYSLSLKQRENLLRKGIELDVIDQILAAIMREKYKIGWDSSFPGTTKREIKDVLNDQLRKIKDGFVPFEVNVAGTIYYPYPKNPPPCAPSYFSTATIKQDFRLAPVSRGSDEEKAQGPNLQPTPSAPPPPGDITGSDNFSATSDPSSYAAANETPYKPNFWRSSKQMSTDTQSTYSTPGYR